MSQPPLPPPLSPPLSAEFPDDEPDTKRRWRARQLARRRQVPPDVRGVEADALAKAVVEATRGCTGPVCCYVPVGTEPGSLAMLDALREAGHEVLLPVVPLDAGSDTGRTLSWAPYCGADRLTQGPFGLRQPTGADRAPAAAIALAGFVLVPALAVDHRGARLGRGAGWYDRALPLARPRAPLVAVVRDDELVLRLPTEPHDVPMTGVLTPTTGLRALPLSLD